MPPSDDAEEDGDGKGAQIARGAGAGEAGKARDETEMTGDPTGDRRRPLWRTGHRQDF